MRQRSLPALALRAMVAILIAGPFAARAQLKTLDAPQGGTIVYGPVEGATTQAMAMGQVLRNVHDGCRERPKVGRPFRLRGSSSTAVFFTVVNHPRGEKQVAGLVIAAASAGRVEAALVSDDAARFGRTINPMLERLFAEWHPAAAGAMAGAPPPGGRPSDAPAASGPAARLHPVTAQDGSVSIGIPDGWTMDPGSGRGSILVRGPQGEVVAFGLGKTGIDPNHPWQRNFSRTGGRPQPGAVVHPHPGDLRHAFPTLVQAWRRSNGLPPAKLAVDKVDPFPAPPNPPGWRCVVAQGHVDPDGKGMKRFADLMCAGPTLEWGGYPLTLSHRLVPDELFDRETPTFVAMGNSLRMNAQVLDQQIAAAARQKANEDAAVRAQTRVAIDNIHAIGRAATARMQATEAANDAQHAGYWAQQDTNARRGQAFSNYLLDQTVIQSNDLHGNRSGVLGHGTVWNTTADALVSAHPDRYELVDPSGFWKGIDY